jgi:hypothetical protein
MNEIRKPSPAILVAVLALVAAFTGTAVAGPDASTSAITKKKVASIATKQINKLAPGLSVAHADTASNATNAQNAAHADTATTAAHADTADNSTSAQNANSLDGLNSTDFLRSNDPSSIPTVQVTRTSALSTDDGEVTDLTWDAESYDTASMHDNSTNPGRLTAPVDGIYAVTVQVDWDFNVAGRRTLALLAVNSGSTNPAAIEDRPPTNDGFANPTLTTQVQLAAGGYVEANVEQTSGGSLDVNAPTGQTKFSMTWLAPGP